MPGWILKQHLKARAARCCFVFCDHTAIALSGLPLEAIKIFLRVWQVVPAIFGEKSVFPIQERQFLSCFADHERNVPPFLQQTRGFVETILASKL